MAWEAFGDAILGLCRSSAEDQQERLWDRQPGLVFQSALQMIKVGPPSSLSAVRDPPAQTSTENRKRAVAAIRRMNLGMGPLHIRSRKGTAIRMAGPVTDLT